MPGTHIYTDWVAPNSMRLLTNQLGVVDGFDFVYQKEFDREFAIGDTLRVKEPWRTIPQDGLGWNPASIERRNRTVVMDQVFSDQWIVESLEEALEMERSQSDIQDNIIQPQMKQMAQEVDSRGALFAYRNTPTTVGALGTTPTTLNTFGSARSRIFELGGWATAKKRSMIVTPAMSQGAIDNTVRGLFQPPDEISKAYKEGRMGRYAGFDWTESMSLYHHTAGSVTAGALTVNGAGQSGTSLNINGTSGDDFNIGDHISIAGVNAVNYMTRRTTGGARHFVITADVTLSAATGTLSIFPGIIGPGSPYQNVTALPATLAAITFMPGTTTPNGLDGPFGLAFTDKAFACVGGKLPMPKKGSVEFADSSTDPDTHITLQFIVDWANRERQKEARIDVLMGFGRMWSEFSACRVASDQ